ncbi:DUF4956 domain-containing protein [Streptococcus oralis]|uniref:DUF4956 domain-containing protein n=1 Tax=Streptococcus oralis TaxID=1303 RepID=A0A139PBU1_STROR|nr:DUF4956 domain-containing protein [Streptococcus oralis]KXT85627.1 hypothetical protein SORDD16_01364 [Streptococcus oralis]
MQYLFNSLFTNTNVTADPLKLLVALLISLLLGGALSWVYKFRTLYTREFAISLILLPCLMTLVIFLVNGSLGTSIAVAGTFSLIRFRSATSGSRELIAIFLAMIIGLAAGSGYIFLAILSTLLILGIWLLLEFQQGKYTPQRRRLLTITLPNKEEETATIQTHLEQFCSTVELISLDTGQTGQALRLVYEVDLKSSSDDFQVLNYLTREIPQSTLSITKNAKKRKNL